MLHHVVVGEGKPILILHGSTLDHRHMMETVEPVFDVLEGWQRIYVDMPGHGQSPARDDINTQDDLLAAVIEFATQAVPTQPFAIIGESRGSYIAQGMVHLHPELVNGVAMLVPGGSPTADPNRLPRHKVMEADPALRAELTDRELASYENFMVVQNPDIMDKWRRSKAPARELWSAEQEERVGAHFDFSFHLAGETTVFHGPSLIIAGLQDRMSGHLDAIDLLTQFPRATLAVLDAAGHGLAWERPDLVNALLRDWLARLQKYS